MQGSKRLPKKGSDMSNIGIIYNGSVVIEDGIIVDVDEASNISSKDMMSQNMKLLMHQKKQCFLAS